MNLNPPTGKPIITGLRIVWGIPAEFKPIRVPEGYWAVALSFENRREARVTLATIGRNGGHVRETILVAKGDYWEPHPTIDRLKQKVEAAQ
jgi:hypothetical protein